MLVAAHQTTCGILGVLEQECSMLIYVTAFAEVISEVGGGTASVVVRRKSVPYFPVSTWPWQDWSPHLLYMIVRSNDQARWYRTIRIARSFICWCFIIGQHRKIWLWFLTFTVCPHFLSRSRNVLESSLLYGARAFVRWQMWISYVMFVRKALLGKISVNRHVVWISEARG